MKWRQVGTQIGSKIGLNFERSIFQKIAFRNLHRLLIDFGANLLPFSLPKSSKILSKIDFKTHHFFYRFWHRFFYRFSSILGPKLDSCWPPRRPQDASRTPREALWGGSGLCWDTVFTSTGSKEPPRPPGPPLGGRFCWGFDSFLVDFWWIFNCCLDHQRIAKIFHIQHSIWSSAPPEPPRAPKGTQATDFDIVSLPGIRESLARPWSGSWEGQLDGQGTSFGRQEESPAHLCTNLSQFPCYLPSKAPQRYPKKPPKRPGASLAPHL